VGWYLMIPPISALPPIDDGTIRSTLLNLWTGHVYENTNTLQQLMTATMLGDDEPVFSSNWITVASFERLDECEARMSRMQKSVEDESEKKVSELSLAIVQRGLRYAAANCIATDDPRLAK